MSTNIRCPERARRSRTNGPIIGCAGSNPHNRLFAMGRKRFDWLGEESACWSAALPPLTSRIIRKHTDSRESLIGSRARPLTTADCLYIHLVWVLKKNCLWGPRAFAALCVRRREP
jgi:hypothetical protein